MDQANTYQRLRLLILQRELGSGAPLVERALADLVGVSRTPVRESLLRLEREGLVRIVEGKGAFVANYTIEDVIEIYQVREGVEGMAARLSCGHINPERLDYFDKQLRRYMVKPSLREEQSEAWQKLGRDFHDMFIDACGNSRLIRSIEVLKDQIELFRGLTMAKEPSFTKTAVEEHLEILRAFRENSPAKAEQAVRQHISNGLQYRIELLRRNYSGH